jgi:hypothetical protein
MGTHPRVESSRGSEYSYANSVVYVVHCFCFVVSVSYA